MRGRKACLLSNHGMIAAGMDIAEAYRNAIEVENLSELYLRTLQVGEPVLLTAEEFADALNRFATYGKPRQ
jgi:L-fuculose-phosphate aldolase